MVKKKTKRKRTTKRARKKKLTQAQELDSVFFLKIVMFMVLGSVWIRLVDPALTTQIPLPVGLALGLIFASHEHFQIDRKIEISVLLVSALLGFWVFTGASIVIL